MASPLGSVLDCLILKQNEIKLTEIPENIEIILKKNDFLSYFGHSRLIDLNNTTIKYLKLKPSDGRFFHNYIANELLNRSELPFMSHGLKKKIAESLYEIFVNAQIHSESDFIYTCGQFYPKKHCIEFTLTDTGIGFKNKINQQFGTNLPAHKAISWAVKDGHTTKKGISGGIGLSILKEFITKNKGKFQIISSDGFYQLDENGEKTKLFNGEFPGTIINVQFQTNDNMSYRLIEDTNTNDIF
jgi:hypothetical protein